jgi:hypothetical protein
MNKKDNESNTKHIEGGSPFDMAIKVCAAHSYHKERHLKRTALPHHFWLALTLSGLLAACGGSSNTPSPNPVSPVGAAIASGNAKPVALADLLSSTQTLLSTQTANYATAKQTLFGLNSNGSANASSLTGLTWNPTHDSSYFTILDGGRNQIVLPSNWSYANNAAGTGVGLAVIGTASSTHTRYAAFGGNPLGVPGNAAMDAFMSNTMTWLTPRASSSGFKVVTAHLPGTETYYFPHESAVRAWFASHYPGVIINGQPGGQTQADNLCDGSALAGCLQNADLLVIGREQGPSAYDGTVVMQAVSDAQARGIPVLYLHHYRDANDLASRLLAYFGLGQNNNYWGIEGLNAFDPSTLPQIPPQLAGLADMLTRLDQGTFSTDWSGCTIVSMYPTNCSTDATYMSQFGSQATQLRNTLRQLDANGTALFSLGGYELEKRLVLIGDKYRESVAYPLDKTANQQDFMRALFSDVTAYVHRPYASVAKNLGNFSGLFPASTPTLSRQINVALPLSGSRDYATGLYAMPGSTITLTRSDTSGSTVTFALNMLRDTTFAFNPNGLVRPKQISSPRMPLGSGQSVTITSPYGGPLYLFLTASTSGAQTVTVQVDGVITHPLLRDATDPAQVTAFEAEVANTPTNWVIVTSDAFTLHSSLTNFRSTLTSYSNNIAKFASDIWTYTIKDIYELAGFNMASGKLSLPATVASFCTAHGWDCTGTQHRRDQMQHAISDMASCGSGCSGNPFDMNGGFTPLDWGVAHEIGHNLQRDRLKIFGGISTEVSNNIFPIHNAIVYNQSADGKISPKSDRPGSATTVFNDMTAAIATANPVAAMTATVWTDPSYGANNSERLMFYRQLVEYARYYNPNIFSDGWEVYTLLYLLERNFSASANTWASVATSYGFGTYASYPSSISGNDFMLVASSFIIGRDLRPMFDLWGISYTSAAAAQVAANGTAPVQALLFPMKDMAQFSSGVGSPVVIGPGAVYPSGY